MKPEYGIPIKPEEYFLPQAQEALCTFKDVANGNDCTVSLIEWFDEAVQSVEHCGAQNALLKTRVEALEQAQKQAKDLIDEQMRRRIADLEKSTQEYHSLLVCLAEKLNVNALARPWKDVIVDAIDKLRSGDSDTVARIVEENEGLRKQVTDLRRETHDAESDQHVALLSQAEAEQKLDAAYSIMRDLLNRLDEEGSL